MDKCPNNVGNVVIRWKFRRGRCHTVRWYFFSNSTLASIVFIRMVNEVKRKFISGLWNTYDLRLYADIDKFDPSHSLDYVESLGYGSLDLKC